MRPLIFCLLSLTACGGSFAQRHDPSTGARKLSHEASMALEVSEEEAIEPALTKAEEIAVELGGYVVSKAQERVHVKVPAPRLEEALGKMAALGTVTRKELRAQDVSAQYTDLEIRIANLRALRVRLSALLSKATEVPQLLAIEKELGRVTMELESLEGKLRLLKNQVRFARLELRVEESVSPGPLGWVPYGVYLGVKWLFVWD